MRCAERLSAPHIARCRCRLLAQDGQAILANSRVRVDGSSLRSASGPLRRASLVCRVAGVMIASLSRVSFSPGVCSGSMVLDASAFSAAAAAASESQELWDGHAQRCISC